MGKLAVTCAGLLVAVLLASCRESPSAHVESTPAPATTLATAPATAPATVMLKKEQWVALPEMNELAVGSDGRAWYAVRPTGKIALEQFKKIIEEQFNKPNPQISHAVVGLFEPGGRVWFTYTNVIPQRKDAPARSHATVLLGYDGKSWIVHESDRGFQGRPHGLFGNWPNNAYVDGHAFFPAGDELHVFDGKEWRVHRLWDGGDRPEIEMRSVWLVPEPDGKGLLILSRRSSHPVWRWRAGKMQMAPVPPLAFAGITHVSPAPGGYWYSLYDVIGFSRYDQPVVTKEQYLQQLNSSEAKERRAAVEALATADWHLVQFIEARATPTAESQELIARLKKRSFGTPTVRIGPFTADQILTMYPDGQGRTFFVARSVSSVGATPCPAIIMQDRDGKVTAIAGPVADCRTTEGPTGVWADAAAVPGTNGRYVWLPADVNRAGRDSGYFRLDSGVDLRDRKDKSMN